VIDLRAGCAGAAALGEATATWSGRSRRSAACCRLETVPVDRCRTVTCPRRSSGLGPLWGHAPTVDRTRTPPPDIVLHPRFARRHSPRPGSAAQLDEAPHVRR
jgi:hypothetical protein